MSEIPGKLEIHPDAAANFNLKGKDLLGSLKAPSPQPENRRSFKADRFIAHQFTQADIIGTPIIGLVDNAGNELARYFEHNGQPLGLFDEGFAAVHRLAESFQKCKTISPVVSREFLVDCIFDWVEATHKGKSSAHLVDHVLEACPLHIKKMDIWIPIAGLHVQSALSVGRVLLKPITAQMFDAWEAAVVAKHPPQEKDILDFFKRERKQLQGLAAATIELSAEPKRAREIAFEEAEKAIGLLRFFEGTNFEPEMVSYCAPVGQRQPAFRKHLVLNEGLLGSTDQHLTERSNDWTLSDSDIADLNRDGLLILNGLIARDGQLSEFEEKLMGSLLIYSRNCLERLPIGKLIYILSSLESVLLKNSTEGIEQNLGERMAFLIAKGVPERKAVIANIKEIYRLRSQFLHHGITIENLAAMRIFMRNAWMLFHALLRNSSRLKTMQNLFDSIDQIKLS